MRQGILAEFETPEALLTALDELWKRGYRELDAFTPYPIHGVDRALRLSRSPLPWILLPFAVLGTAFGYLLQWWTNAVDYPLDVGGRPPHAAPAFVPITFETLVLVTAVTGFILFLVIARLPELWNPIFEVEGFNRASIDRFWIGIDARDPMLTRTSAERDLLDVGALRVAWAGKEPR